MSKTWIVMLTTSNGRIVGYVIQALNKDIAIDASVRGLLTDSPDDSLRSSFAYDVTLEHPLKFMDSK